VYIAVALPAASFALYGAMMFLFARGMWRRRKPRQEAMKRAPRVTVLKPLAGCDDDLEANLESFARLDYPSFELLLGVASPDDPAAALARRFLARHPRLDGRVVLTHPDAAFNPKVAQLVGLEQVATGDVYVISDSNVRVQPDYLWAMVERLADDRVGLVTSLFSGAGERTLGAALENLQLCSHCTPGLVALDAVTSRPLTIGKSMAMRRRDLVRLGGFVPVGSVLAEDYALGRRFLDAGLRIHTSLHSVENRNVDCTMARTFERHSRWSKMRHVLYPVGFAFEPLMTPILAASIGVLLAPGKVTAAVLGATCIVQTAVAMGAVRVLRGHWMPWRYIPLELVRSFVMLVCWGRGWASRRVDWRGHIFAMSRGTAIQPVASGAAGSSTRARLAA
jgi:ceramide glucosyltransferase